MAQVKKLPWFRIYTNNRATIERIDSAKVGDALKAALRYVDHGGQDEGIEEGITDPITLLAFGLLKQGADDSIEYHEASKAAGKKGAEAKREKLKELQAQIDELQSQYGGNEPTPAATNLDSGTPYR